MTKFKSVLRIIYCRWKKLTTRRKSREDIHQYWRHPDDGMNSPEQYSRIEGGELDRSRELRSLFLVDLMKRYSQLNANILEIGCNVGRNLHYLFQAGFTKLNGIDISENAIRSMKKYYPEMAKNAKAISMPIEDAIKNFQDNEFDVVFTMAVLEHVHPDSEFIFSEIVRITKKTLIIIEDERLTSWRHFPRNYKKVFESVGMKQVFHHTCGKEDGLRPNFQARVFDKY